MTAIKIIPIESESMAGKARIETMGLISRLFLQKE